MTEADTPIKSLFGHVADLAQRQPQKAALIGCDEEGKSLQEISYAQLPIHLLAAFSYLRSLGLKKGDKVALAFKNSPELLVLSWAAWAAGIVTVPLDVKRDTEELCAYKIKLNEAKALILQKGALGKQPTVDVPVIEFTQLTVEEKSDAVWESGLTHPALILFTSGTTAHPKGAKLSLENLIVNADGIRQWLHITKDDTFLVQLPLHHINSTTFCLSSLLAGATIAIPPQYSNSRFWQQASATGATLTSIVQSILADQLDRTAEFAQYKKDIALNRIQIGSAPVVAHSVQEFVKKFGIKVYQGYGQTETALRVSGVPMDISPELYERLVEENSIGTAMPWADLQIADNEGNILKEGEEGELVVRGKAVMEGYVGGEDAFRDGWFLTGDVGLFKMIDGQRFFYLKGRSREIIIKGGVNISPVAVENGLKKLFPDIAQVYVIGYPDERYGEEVAAAIIWRLPAQAGENVDPDGMMRRLKLTLMSGTDVLPAYEAPRYLATIDKDELPLTSTGKVQRTVLRKNLPPERFSSVYEMLKTPRYAFEILTPRSPRVKESFDLYNHCWQPLSVDMDSYAKAIGNHTILLAIDEHQKLAGQIAIVRTNLNAAPMLKTTYADLLTPRVLAKNGKAFVCISICSAEFKSRSIPPIAAAPDEKMVQAYLAGGHDGVMRFHQKPKGGLSEGARLVGLIPHGRPEDKSSCGYNVLVQYPDVSGGIQITEGAPVSDQLIEAAMLLAHDLGLKDVYAYSRPGGLATYLAKQEGEGERQ